MVTIHPTEIMGGWDKGYALDIHTTSSTPVGQYPDGRTQFDTVRPAISQLLFQLKYRDDQGAAQEIVATTAHFLYGSRAKFDLIVPAPASKSRVIQPVVTIANGIGASLNLPVVQCITTTRTTAGLKDVSDHAERERLLNGLYVVDARHTNGKRVLLIDDLYRSGDTLNALTDVLRSGGGAASVCVLTITRTRKN